MRKLIAIIAGILFMTFLASAPAYAAEYPGLLKVTKVRDDIITGVDGTGNEWVFLDPCNDWQNGDLCGVIFDDNGTDVIYDDCIRQTRYVGYVDLYR